MSTPSQPGRDHPADRDDRGARQGDNEDVEAGVGRSVGHDEALSHIAECLDCRKKVFELVLVALVEAENERSLQLLDEGLRQHVM